MKIFQSKEPFTTESGSVLHGIEIAYHTWGELDSDAGNVLWVCHALTANSDVEAWWPGMVGPGRLFDPEKYFIVCANILGSCYGSTGPSSVDPGTGKQWLRDFPLITVRDLVTAHELLRKHLGIKKIHTIIGASIGGYQALEYSIINPCIFQHVVLIATNARQSPWAIGFNESQRLALEADCTFATNDPEGGRKGLKAARSVALLSYRSGYAYNTTQKEDDDEKLLSFKASSYQEYQGEKLVKRFNPYSYWTLTRLSDSHNIGRGRGGILNALGRVKAEVLCIGITSDILFPTDEQKYLAAGIPSAGYVEIDSFYGHDGFLIETETVTKVVRDFWERSKNLEK